MPTPYFLPSKAMGLKEAIWFIFHHDDPPEGSHKMTPVSSIESHLHSFHLYLLNGLS